MKFPVSVWTGYYPELSTEEAIETFLTAGFHYTELSTDHAKKLLERDGSPEHIGAELAAYASDRGFSILQGHLSFNKGLLPDEAIDSIKRELDLFHGIGIRAAVLHVNGGGKLEPEERFARHVERVREVADYVEGTDITICLENLGSVPETHTAERLLKYIDAAGGKNLGICLDIGHLHLVNGRGEAQQTQTEFIHLAGDRLKALHVTNNSGLGDVHLMPFSSRYGVDYQEVVRALKDVGYKGLFNFEILGECVAPMEIRRLKLGFIRKMADYMMTDEFLEA